MCESTLWLTSTFGCGVVVYRSCATFCGQLSDVVVKRERGRWHVVFSQIKIMS